MGIRYQTINGKLWSWIRTYLTNRTLCVFGMSYFYISTCGLSLGTGLLCLFLPIMLCCSCAHKIYLLCSKLCSRLKFVLSLLSLFVCKFAWISHYSANTVERLLLGCIYKWQQNTLYVVLDNDCPIRVYQSFVAIFQKYFLLCWHYA